MPSKFLCDLYTPGEANVITFGVPLGKDSKNVLRSLRETSDFLEVFDIDKEMNLLEDSRICDIGNLKLKKLEEITTTTKNILDVKKIPMVLGGGHLISLYTLKAFKDVKLIVFDAHCDLKKECDDKEIQGLDFINGIKFDPKVNDATWLRNACKFIDPKNIFLIGIRSCDEFEFEFMKKNGISYATPNQIKNDIEKVKKRLRKFAKGANVYVSIDVDGFDPSIAPKVDLPEPNGLLLNEFIELIKALEKSKLAGLDLCCIKDLDDNQRTEFLGIRALLEVLSLLSR
jgi:arginase family enzyme